MPDEATTRLPEIDHARLTTPPASPEHPSKHWYYRTVWAEDGFIIVARFHPEYRTVNKREVVRTVSASIGVEPRRIGDGWCQQHSLVRTGECTVTEATVEQHFELFLMRVENFVEVIQEHISDAVASSPDATAGPDIGPPQITTDDLPGLTSNVGVFKYQVRQGDGDATLQGESSKQIGTGWHEVATTITEGADAVPADGTVEEVPIGVRYRCPDADDADEVGVVRGNGAEVAGVAPPTDRTELSLCAEIRSAMDQVRAKINKLYSDSPEASERAAATQNRLDELVRQHERLEMRRDLCQALADSGSDVDGVLLGLTSVLEGTAGDPGPGTLDELRRGAGLPEIASEFDGELDLCERYSVLIRYLEAVSQQLRGHQGRAEYDARGYVPNALPIPKEPDPSRWEDVRRFQLQIDETEMLIQWAEHQRERCADLRLFELSPEGPFQLIGPGLVGQPLTPEQLEGVLNPDGATDDEPRKRSRASGKKSSRAVKKSSRASKKAAATRGPDVSSPYRKTAAMSSVAHEGPSSFRDDQLARDQQSLLDRVLQLLRQYWYIPTGVLALIAAGTVVLLADGGGSTGDDSEAQESASVRTEQQPPSDPTPEESAPAVAQASDAEPAPEPDEQPPAAEPAPNPDDLDLDDPEIQARILFVVDVLESFGLEVDPDDDATVEFVLQAVSDQIADEQRSEQPGVDANLEIAPEIIATASTPITATQAFLDRGFNASSHPCGAVTDAYVVTCPLAAGLLPAGDYVIITVELGAPIDADPSTTRVYGLFMDDDGDDSDNFGFVPPFTESFIRNTEYWYQLQIDPDGTRTMWVDGYRDGTPGVPRYSSAVVIEFESTLVWLIPRAEIPGDAPAYRASAFATTGDPTLPPDPAESGGDASGASAAEPLLPIDTSSPIVADDASGLPPDIDGTQPRVPVESDPDAQITAALFAEVDARINAALASGDVEQVVALLHPQFATGSTAAACRAEIEASLALADSVLFTSVPAAPDLSGPLPFYVAQATISYPTGDVQWGPVFLPGPKGRLYLVLPACAQAAE